jgi:hypothetical protein
MPPAHPITGTQDEGALPEKRQLLPTLQDCCSNFDNIASSPRLCLTKFDALFAARRLEHTIPEFMVVGLAC